VQRVFWITLIPLVLLVACWRAPSPALPALPAGTKANAQGARPAISRIQHVVFIVQENRTFDNLFGGPNPFPQATATDSGEAVDGDKVRTIKLKQVELATYTGTEDPDNYHREWLWACHPSAGPPFPVGKKAPCRMDGFNIAASPHPNYTPPASVGTIYSYVNYKETKPYWDIARKYSLGDHFFMGHNSESYTAHQYIFSAQSNNVVDSPDFNKDPNYCDRHYDYCAFTPWGCDSPAGSTTFHLDPITGEESPKATGPFPCFGQLGPRRVKYPSLANRVGEARLTWRLYAHSLCANINGLDVNAPIRYGDLWPKKPDMANCHENEGAKATSVDTPNFRMPEYTFLDDIKDSNRELANVTWILPGLASSDHPGVPFGWCGPSWVASLVDAIGESKYWNSTVIFIFWDDWGGFYDHVPPYVVRDQEGPGFRVPLLVVSPYVRHNHVAHTEIEFATLLKYTEKLLRLKSLDATDASDYLNNLNDFFQPNAQPFEKIDVPKYNSCSVLARKRPRDSRSRWLRMDGDD